MEEPKQIEEILRRFEPERENLLPVLQEIQETVGYLSRGAMEQVAHYFRLPPSEVFSLVTFYNQFRRKPPGRHPIHVCLGTACYLMGGSLILDAFSRELHIPKGETTEDGTFSLDATACFGCCNVAPVVKINDQIFSRMTTGKVEEVLINLRDRDREKAS
ncbi:MAG: NADH-quinone oxidoreductase subunit NuoE [Desulfobacterota bacterium]|nr:NADH-quinone oxidoreductase subunit NuoE [Thermodesulfobacteriota bacterium]